MALPSVDKTRVPGSAVIASLKLAFKDAGVIRPAISRSVAQSGSAPRSGRGGGRLKPCHSDHYLAGPESTSPTVSPTVIAASRPVASARVAMVAGRATQWAD